MLRFIVCEDNKESLERICNIINRVMMPYNYEYKTNKFTSYNKEVSELIKTKYEEKIYVLDIELGDVSGLEIASQIRHEDPESVIIFTFTVRCNKNNNTFRVYIPYLRGNL